MDGTPAESERAPARWPGAIAWIATVLGVVAVVWLCVGLLRSCSPVAVAETAGGAARDVAKTLADVLKPTVVSNPLVVLRGEDDQPKLVVYTHAADVSEDLVSDAWFGDTYSRIVARNCRAQFFIPLDEMTAQDVAFVPGGPGRPGQILITAPKPRLDLGMLVIAPESIEFTERATGLRRVTAWMETDRRDELTKHLRPRLMEAMADPKVRERAAEAARKFFEERFAKWLRPGTEMGRDVRVEVRWR